MEFRVLPRKDEIKHQSSFFLSVRKISRRNLQIGGERNHGNQKSLHFSFFQDDAKPEEPVVPLKIEPDNEKIEEKFKEVSSHPTRCHLSGCLLTVVPNKVFTQVWSGMTFH